ncbi:MAG TPA: hypothetical protein P5532_18255 [Planctomycetota bacterium]|nr:hypothetical protein [Planctomycetota bacterium]
MMGPEFRTPHSALRPRGGFTIIEILLAIGILAISITSVLFLFAMGMRSHKRALDRSRAALLAEAVANQLQAGLKQYADPKDPRDPTVAPPSDATHPDFPGFTYTATFAPLYGGTSYYRVTLLIRWGDPNEPAEARNSETYETVLQRKSF